MSYTVYDNLAQFFAASGASRGEGKVWRAGSYLFIEAASGATDHHVTNAAGVKFYVDLTPEWINVQCFNVFHTRTPSENKTGLFAMRDAFVAEDNDRLWKVRFPSGGTYQYDDDGWTEDIKHLEIEGYGAWLQPVDASNFHFHFGSDAIYSSPGEADIFGYHGHEIDTMARGATTVTFKTPGDESNFAVGDAVLLCSQSNMFFAYPPNFRKFQFTEVTAVGTGTVTVKEPALFTYQDDDIYVHNSESNQYLLGKARILNLNRGGEFGRWPLTRILRGVGLKKKPDIDTSSAGAGIVVTGRYVLWEDVTVDYEIELWPTVADTVIIRNMKTTGPNGSIYAEPDKTVRKLVFEGFTMTGPLNGGTGVWQSHFKDMEFLGRISYTSLDQVLYERCRIAIPSTEYWIGTYSAIGPGRVQFKDCDIEPNVSPIPDAAVSSYFVLDQQPSAVPSANVLRFSEPVDIGQTLREECLIWSTDGTDIGVVKSWSHLNGAIDVTVDWLKSATPAITKTYQITTQGCIADLGGNTLQNVDRFFRHRCEYAVTGLPLGADGGLRARYSLTLTPRMFTAAASSLVTYLFQEAPRIIERVSVNVVRPYTGATASPTFEILFGDVQTGAWNTQTISIDPKVTGLRVAQPSGNAGFGVGESADLTDRWQHQAQISMSTQTYANDGEAPYVVVDMDYFVPGHKP